MASAMAGHWKLGGRDGINNACESDVNAELEGTASFGSAVAYEGRALYAYPQTWQEYSK